MSDPASNHDHGTILRVAVPSPLRTLFDYLPPKKAASKAMTGVRIRVPFGRRQVIGIVVALTDSTAIANSKLRHASEILDDEALLPETLTDLLEWAGRYYQHPPGDVWSTALPVRIRQGTALNASVEIWRPATDLESATAQLSRAPRQLALLLMLLEAGQMSREEILGEGFSSQQLNELSNKQLVTGQVQRSTPEKPFAATRKPLNKAHALHEEQQAALAAIAPYHDTFHCFLLDGITGSGKTEVYMQLMAEVLAHGKQCLILVPEIGLTPQTIARFTSRFSVPIVAMHSGMNDTERCQAWLQARAGSAAIIIGTRSAIFTPLLNPGLIIVDEEHDSSFKQQDGFRYSARDLAVMRGQREQVPVLLGTATPSLESLHNALQGRFTHLRLQRRAGASVPAAMQVIDINNADPQTAFSESALLQMRQQLDAGNQVLAFINRRGYAPMLQCLQCGWIAECDHCTAHLTYHTRPASLRCHHCGEQSSVPTACPGCQGRKLTTMGVGTQQLEAYLEAEFADVPTIRIDRDSTRSKTRLADLLAQVNAGEPCVLLGTQMLAKGHHFPNITLVVIIDADGGLFSADFRGQENMAQTIVQVSGRAGRSQRPGKVLIQSRHATHAILQQLTTASYHDFAINLLAERKATGMPPFAHLALFRTEADKPETGTSFLRDIGAQCAHTNAAWASQIDCLGPMPCPMEKRAGRYRSQLLLKCDSRAALQAMLAHLIQTIETQRVPAKLRWSLDVDPQELI